MPSRDECVVWLFSTGLETGSTFRFVHERGGVDVE